MKSMMPYGITGLERVNSLIPYDAKRALVWMYSKTNLGLHVKCKIFLANFNQIWIFSTEFS